MHHAKEIPKQTRSGKDYSDIRFSEGDKKRD